MAPVVSSCSQFPYHVIQALLGHCSICWVHLPCPEVYVPRLGTHHFGLRLGA